MLTGILLALAMAMCLVVPVSGANPPPTQVYYVPFPEADQLAGYVGISNVAVDPLAVFVSFSAATDGTVIYYDHWEDGYEKDITNPKQATTRVFGDGNPANGYPPGNAGDLISAGTMFSLRNYVTSTTTQAVLDYDGRDKIGSFKPISVTKTSFPASTNTLLAGCVEVFERGIWGTDYRVPVGANMPSTTAGATLTWDADIFSYTALSIMAGAGGATVQVDADNNGTYEQSFTLAEGGSRYVTGVNVGGRVTSDKPVQVVLFAGRPTSNYQSRDTSLLPVNRWSSTYYAPISTVSTNGTVVFLYNPGASAITVSYDYRSSTSAYTTATVSVPAGGNARVPLTEGLAYKFYTTGANPASFYAFCAVDANSNTVGNNQAYDGGFTLVGQPSLTTQVLVSLGIGRDPYSATNPAENGNPVWITTVGNGHNLETVYVDYNGDNAGPLADSNGNRYDVSYSLRELQQQEIRDPDGDQSGMVVYVLNPSVKLAAVWAQNPSRATGGQPGLDVATLIPPLREGDAGKGSSLAVDVGGDGYVSPGDTLEYDIRVLNTARTGINGPFTVKDTMPSEVDYLAGTTKYRYSVNGAWQAWVAVPDDGTGTAFPLDGAGYGVPGTLEVAQQIQVVFKARIKGYTSLAPGTASITNTGAVEVTPYGLVIGLTWTDDLYGSIGDRVWVDANGNGNQDTGESGLNGVVVYADINSNGVLDSGEPSDTTAGDGNYLLGGLPAGTYTVRLDPASVAALDPGYGPTYDLDGIATSYVAGVVLAAGQDRVDADFGLRVGASVGDRIWLDRNNNGVQDSGEPGINGVRVFIDANGNNTYEAGERNAVTFGDGTYYIGNLDAGNHVVAVDATTLPAGITQTYDLDGTGTANRATVALTGAQHRSDADFGYRGNLSIGDLIWEDVDADGNRVAYNVYSGRIDINNTGAVGTGDDGTLAGIQVIDGYLDISGNGSIGTNDDGTFQGIAVIDGALDMNGIGGITAGDTGAVHNEAGIASVRVYIDANGNGAWDSTEAFATTDARGAYTIGNLYNGTYTVRVDTTTLPVSMAQTYDLTSPVDDDTATVTLSGANRTDVDFGYRNDATIGDRVWNDRNNNGVQEAGEPGIEGVVVYIDANGNSLFDQSTERYVITDVNGYYLFDNLAAGTYSIRVEISTLPRGSTQTYDLVGALDNGASRTIAVSEDALNVDFGYRSTASVGDFVWLDANADGIQNDGANSGINGVRVYLDINGNGIFESATEPSAVTAVNGAYTIDGLVAGTYTARVDASTLPAGMVQTHDLAGDLDNAATFTLNPGQARADLDFGYTAPVTIGNLVWNDLNANGVQDNGEPGIDGVEVTIWNSTAGTLAGTTTTAGGGLYAFTTLLPGSYYVEFGLPAGHERSPVDAGGSDAADSDAAIATGRTGVFTLTSGQINETIDAGMYVPATISGSVSADADNNGTGDAAIAGVELNLFTDPNGDGDPADGVLTGAPVYTLPDGSYVFTDVVPGNYVVVQTQPGSYLTVSDGDAIDGSDDTANASVLDNRIPVTVISGETDDGNNFIEELPGTISGHLYIDTNGDGDQDAGEPNLASVDVVITDANGNTQTVATDGSGNWTASVPPGATSADVDETDPQYPAGYTQTEGNDPTGVTAVAGSNISAGNDGYYQPATISGHLYIDTNGDSDQDAGEPNLASVDVVITDANGNKKTVATDGSGNWTASVPPGATSADVDENDPQYPAGHTQTEGDDPTGVTAVAGTNTSAGNDGYYQPATISGHLYIDTNGDSDQDAGEPNLANVDVVITDANGNTQTVATDGSGNWTASVPPGATSADVDENDPQYPAGYTQTEGDDPTSVTAVAGTDTSAGNDGYYQPATVSGHLYIDTNGDSDQDAGEPNLANVDVVIIDANGNTQTVATDGTGNWTASVPPGATSADVDENDPQYPAGYTQTEGDDPTSVTAVAGTDTSAGNDGYFLPGAITGTVRADNNGDSLPDINLQGVTLALLDSSGNPVLDGGGSPRVTTTAADGTYTFSGIAPGDYRVAETQPTGYGSISDKDGGNPDLIGDVTDITVLAGQTNTGNDFLERLQKCPDLWAAWQAKWNTILGGQTGWNQNPDGDRYINLLEYAFCMPPHSGIRDPFCTVGSELVQGGIDGVFSRTANGPRDITYVLEYSAALGNPTSWTPITLDATNTVVTNNGDGSEKVRVVNLEGLTGLTGGRGFVRIRVDLDDGTTVATGATEVQGWVESALALHCQTYNNPFVHCIVFSGTITGVSGQTLDVTQSAGPFDLANFLVPGVAYQIEITSGDNEGHRFDVVSASGAIITLATDSNLNAIDAPHNTLAGALPATLAGDTFVLRRHWTLGEVFPASGWTPAAIQTDADQIQLYAEGAWTNYWLYENAGSPKWVKVGDATLADQGGSVLPPGQGIFINCRKSIGSILTHGEVRENDFRRPLELNANLVGGGYPLDQSAAGRAMTIAAGFKGDRNFKLADQFLRWKGDSIADANGYDTWFLLNGAPVQPTLQRWTKVGDATIQPQDASVLFLGDEATFILMKSALPGYLSPAPWTP